MTCSACSAHVDKAVRKLEGVTEVNVNLLGGSMSVEWNGSLTAEGIIAAVIEAGYGASLAGEKKTVEPENSSGGESSKPFQMELF